MASKKYSGLFGLLCLIAVGSIAQDEGGYKVQDSSVIPAKRLPQHTEFMANNHAFPAKPRSQWEIGLKVGAASISGDVRSRFPGIGGALHVRKALGYVFSIRGEIGYNRMKGLNFSPSQSYRRNPAWASYLSTTPMPSVFYNYKTSIWDLSLQGVVTLNNIRFHKAKSGFNVYAFGGLGGMIYDVKVDALDGTGLYTAKFNTIIAKYQAGGFRHDERRDIKKDLKDAMDNNYETQAERDPAQPDLFDRPFRPVFVIGAGVQFKLSKNVSLALEDKFSSPKTDLLDGQQWQENDPDHPAQSRDFDSYNFVSLGLNLALGGKAVEPLWWLNPLDYAYNEINAPKHMKLPKPVLDDADGDGVTDQFDNEPNTPAGTPVDTHGVSRDTDGDGVPDSKDKELITPTQCQPVDADGVGKCPDPACCDELKRYIDSVGIRGGGACNIGDLPSITFRPRSAVLSNDAKALLASVAQKMRDNATCKVAVIGYCASSKSEQQMSWDRVNAIINHLVEKEGVSADRFIFRHGEVGGDCNTVDLRDGTQEEGPSTVPAPHPNLRRRG